MRYQRVVIDESRSAPSNLNAASGFLASKARDSLQRFVDMEALQAFFKRLRFAARYGVEMPVEDQLIETGLRALATGLTSFRELEVAARDNALLSILRTLVPITVIDEVAPETIRLPSGRRAKVEYHDDKPPSVASRLQDFFGMAETPAVARGKVPLVVELLAPNHRPVQVTMDLASFWKGLYPQVRKELSRRYPKHQWPERPI
jgi:ATP-dependent helicase HrpB